MTGGRCDDSASFEEVLASIRRVLRDANVADPFPYILAQSLRDCQDEQFELPALFRNDIRRHPIPEDRRVAGHRDIPQTLPPFLTFAAKPAERALDTDGTKRADERPDEALSSLALARSVPPPPPMPPAASAMPRVMRSCMDMLVARMGETTSAISSRHASESAERPRLPRYHTEVGPDELCTKDPFDQVDGLIASMVTLQFRKTAVDLLRPIVEQWFEANAPAILDAALRDNDECS